MANDNPKCAHPSCSCAPAKDSKYCGALCEGNAGKPDIICGCGHAACKMKASTTLTAGYGEEEREAIPTR